MQLPNWMKLTLLPIVLVGGSCGQGVLAESMENAVHKAVETHPAIGRINASKRAIDAEVDVARSGYYPLVDFSVGIGRENTDTKSIDNRWENRREASIRLTQLLYDGGVLAARSVLQRQDEMRQKVRFYQSGR